MLEFAFYLYLITILDSISKFCIVIATLLFIGLAVVHLLWAVSLDDYRSADFRQRVSPYLFLRPKSYIAAILGLYLLALIIPSKEVGYIFLGLKVTQTVYQANQNDMDELTKLSIENLKQILKNNLKVPDAKSNKSM